MSDHSEAFVAFDTSKLRNAVTIADDGRGDEPRPTGYGLYRQIKSLGQECIVAAPSLIPKKPGDRVKTNRRDAVGLAKLLRSGDLTGVWVPDRQREAVRDLNRARETAMLDLRAKRQQISGYLLRQGLHYRRISGSGARATSNWLASQKFDIAEHRIVFEELMEAMRQAQGWIERWKRRSAPQCRTGRWASWSSR